MDLITSQVKNLYEQYPYPYTEVKTELLRDLYTLVYFTFSESEIEESTYARYQFFDGGCGSGQRILGLASEFPEATFTCVDMTEHSLRIARAQAEKFNVHNITFKQDNLVDLQEKGQYDVVTSVGVIHHLSEPEKGLLNLSRLVKDDGVIIIHVYHTLGEHNRMLMREVAMTLQGDASMEAGIAIMRTLGQSLPANQYGTYGYNANLTENDHIAKDADVFLHPRVFTYLFREGIDLFRGTDMDWVAVNTVNTLDGSHFLSSSVAPEPYAIDPAELLKDPQLAELYNKLPLPDKFKVLECLLKPTSFSLVAGKRAGLGKIGPRLRNNLVWLQ
jgi:2-polyprenyl-3-methyl-5-hydroxy-6-metoxy-1,4-benzoquinol methylase